MSDDKLEVILSDDCLNPDKYLIDKFRDAFFRSQEIRGGLWHLKEPANRKIADILALSVRDEKTISMQFAAAKYVLDTNIIKYPDISHKTIELQEGQRSPLALKAYEPISRAEVIDAAVVAIEAESHRGDKPDDSDDSKS